MRYSPCVQSEQPEAPVADWYWPAPEQNRQASKELAPSTALYRPTGQSTQVLAKLAPDDVEYLPFPHNKQTPAVRAYWPTEHPTHTVLPRPAE